MTMITMLLCAISFPPGPRDGLFLLLLLVCLHQFAHIILKRRRMKGAKNPPGPKGWPIFGNTFELLPGQGFHVPMIRKWAEEYGPITLFKIGSEKHVIISDHNAARELFVKRGSMYADRFVTHAVSWATMNQNPALRPKDDGWRRERSFIHKSVSITANEKYYALMNEEANLTLRHLLKSPNSSSDQFLRFSYAVLTSTLMGFSVSSTSDPYIVTDQQFRRRFMATFRLDIFPSNVLGFLRKLPSRLIPSYSAMERLRKDHLEQMMAVRRRIEKTVNDGTAKDTIYQHFLKNREDYNITDEELMFTYQAIIGAGTNNPQQALLTSLSLLMEHPEWQKKLQQEIEQVVGRERIPNFGDIPHLPLARAITKEAIRIRGCRREAGLPRRLMEDDFYDGYFFEKGTVFHMNFFTILSDKELYPDGTAFNPDRYLNPSYPTYKEPLTVYPNCQNFPAFGYGRRGCPGADFAERTCVILLIKLAWAFNVQRPLDEEGKEEKEVDIMDWKFRLQARDKGLAEIVERVMDKEIKE